MADPHPRWEARLLRQLEAFAVSAAMVACGSATAPAGAENIPLPVSPAVVEVSMTEYHYGYQAPTHPGRTVFRLVNRGHLIHRPQLVPLPADLPPIQDQVRGSERRVLQPLAGVYGRTPGRSGSFAVDLLPNQRYAFICYQQDDDGVTHSLKGMVSEFRTAG